MQTHYEVLGITPTATDVEIKKAYYKKILQNHPDKHQEEAEKYTKITQSLIAAYEILANTAARTSYNIQIGVHSSGCKRPRPPEEDIIFPHEARSAKRASNSRPSSSKNPNEDYWTDRFRDSEEKLRAHKENMEERFGQKGPLNNPMERDAFKRESYGMFNTDAKVEASRKFAKRKEEIRPSKTDFDSMVPPSACFPTQAKMKAESFARTTAIPRPPTKMESTHHPGTPPKPISKGYAPNTSRRVDTHDHPVQAQTNREPATKVKTPNTSRRVDTANPSVPLQSNSKPADAAGGVVNGSFSGRKSSSLKKPIQSEVRSSEKSKCTPPQVPGANGTVPSRQPEPKPPLSKVPRKSDSLGGATTSIPPKAPVESKIPVDIAIPRNTKASGSKLSRPPVQGQRISKPTPPSQKPSNDTTRSKAPTHSKAPSHSKAPINSNGPTQPKSPASKNVLAGGKATSGSKVPITSKLPTNSKMGKVQTQPSPKITISEKPSTRPGPKTTCPSRPAPDAKVPTTTTRKRSIDDTGSLRDTMFDSSSWESEDVRRHAKRQARMPKKKDAEPAFHQPGTEDSSKANSFQRKTQPKSNSQIKTPSRRPLASQTKPKPAEVSETAKAGSPQRQALHRDLNPPHVTPYRFSPKHNNQQRTASRSNKPSHMSPADHSRIQKRPSNARPRYTQETSFSKLMKLVEGEESS